MADVEEDDLLDFGENELENDLSGTVETNDNVLFDENDQSHTDPSAATDEVGTEQQEPEANNDESASPADQSTTDEAAETVDEQTAADDTDEIQAIKDQVTKMEEEANRLRAMQKEVENQIYQTPPQPVTPAQQLEMTLKTPEEKIEVDSRSIFVGNVDYASTAEELEKHFHGCGSVNRVTIACDKFSGHPKGFAYIEFAEKDSVDMAMALDETLFRGRQIKVQSKRTNTPGISTTNRGRGRGGYRGGRGRGGGGAVAMYMMPVSGYRPWRSRGRRANYFSPY